ncbi:MAG TPA: molybdopterin-dependent oxidoreductase [Hyphomicrobiaceae bacterium]|nr:molybdopterin-dependent oxidoreductase [Hyphomicrobiaceae bacterium]
MQQLVQRTFKSACPHDCPSACALEVPVLADGRIGRITGARDNSYTLGVVCAKVARYAERIEHPDRLLTPLRRKGAKGSGEFAPISWEDALGEIAERFTRVAQRSGTEAVWPYHSGGNMGVLQRYGLDRLRNPMRYSRQQTTICVTPAESGWLAGVGKLVGPDPREMEDADLIVIWGANPVSTQVNVMTHVARARKARGTRLVVVDVYRTPTVEQADMALVLKPGSDGALALAVMNVLLTENLVDREYLARFTDFDADTKRHILTRTPEWAAGITGLSVEDITAFARLYGTTRKSFLRAGFGFTRTRNGSSAMHAVSCLPSMTGAWREKGGGAFFLSFDKEQWGLDTSLINGVAAVDTSIRMLDQSRIGAVLCGEPDALRGGPPVEAMLMQNANSATVAPDTGKVLRGLGREDVFIAVQEQFLTPTARFADIVLPATMFVEHDDIYYGLGHTHLTFGPKVVEPRGQARPNSYTVRELGRLLGCDHPCLTMGDRELLDHALASSGFGSFSAAAEQGWIDRALPFSRAHFLDGFPQPGGKFRFKPDWTKLGRHPELMPAIADWSPHYEQADAQHPFKLVCPPARSFLNSTFSETPSSISREKGPRVRIHPDAAAQAGLKDGDRVRIGNARGSVVLAAAVDAGQQTNTLIVEGIWPATAFEEKRAINTLIGDDPVPPNGGAGFHDTAVWLQPA